MDTEEIEDYFRLQFEQNYNHLHFYAREILQNNWLAEEIVQETFLIAWAKYEQFIQSPNPGGWLMDTLKYAIRNLLRQYKSNMPPSLPLEEAIYVEDESNVLDDHLTESELYDECMRILPENDYSILHKVIVEGYTCVEVASMMGYKKNTCQKRLQRILGFLKNSDELSQFFDG